jgi:hypothetical protein
MMRLFLCAAALGAASATSAEEQSWVPLNGPQITEALTDRVLDYGHQWQDFRSSGRTLYFSGRESWGYWEVRGDQYCSMWPPSDLWACYDMARKDEQLRFIDAAGNTSEARYKDLVE